MKTLRKFQRMMKRLRPYLPKPVNVPEEPVPEWQPHMPGTILWPPRPLRGEQEERR